MRLLESHRRLREVTNFHFPNHLTQLTCLVSLPHQQEAIDEAQIELRQFIVFPRHASHSKESVTLFGDFNVRSFSIISSVGDTHTDQIQQVDQKTAVYQAKSPSHEQHIMFVSLHPLLDKGPTTAEQLERYQQMECFQSGRHIFQASLVVGGIVHRAPSTEHRASVNGLCLAAVRRPGR